MSNQKLLKISRAIISVYDKEGVVDFCKVLARYKIDIISTGSTARLLKSADIPVQEVKDYIDFPEILEGRVKTLHPRIHAGILARKDKRSDLSTLKRLNIKPIDMIVVNLYPFQEKRKVLRNIKEILEFIDIGGPTLLRAGAKNFLNVCAVPDKKFYSEVAKELRRYKGRISLRLRKTLAGEVFKRTSLYDYAIHNFLSGDQKEEIMFCFEKKETLRYGENPHQKGYFYSYGGGVLGGLDKLQGKPLSYNNFLDISSGLRILEDFKEPCCVVIKHTNPCGLALDDNLEKAYIKAYKTDEISSFGGIVGFNRRVDKSTARRIVESGFREIVFSVDFTKGALKVFSSKKNLIVCKVKVKYLGERGDYRFIKGGLLVQDRDKIIYKRNLLEFPTRKKPSPRLLEELLFAFKVVKHLKSNAICISKGYRTLGLGMGLPSRIDAVKLAIKKAGDCRGAVLASDGFFPYPDSIEVSFKAGIKAIIQPGGSIRDKDIISACNKYKIPMVFTHIRHFLH